MSDIEHPSITVVHVDPFTGIVLEPTPPFTRYNSGSNQNHISFDTATEAVEYCEETVREHPYVHCVVNGLPRGSQCDFGDVAWVETESKRRTEQNALLAEELALRNRRDQFLMMAFVTAILIVALLYTFTRLGG